MSRLTVGSLEGLSENSNVISVPTGHTLNVADAGALQIGGSGVVSAGLVHISRTTIGSSVSSVTVSGAFSSTYANYRIAISEGSSSTAVAGLLMTVAGAGASDHYSTVLYYTMGSGTAGTAVQNGTSYIDIGGVRGTIMDVMNAGETTNQIFVSSLSGDPQYFRACVGRINYTSIPASFTLLPNAGTLTGGYIDVYGYAKA